MKTLSRGPEMKKLLPAAVIYTFICFGGVLISSTYVYLVEQALCRKYYMLHEPSRVGINGLVDEEICKMPEIEVQVASIYGIFNSLTYLPTLLMAGSYREIGSLLGRRTVLLMNLTTYAVSASYFMTICYFYNHFDIRWIYLTPFFDVFGGGSVILWSFLYTYISEIVGSERLSGVLYKLSAIQLLMTFLGLTVSSFTLRQNVWLQVSIGITCTVILIPVALLLPDSRQASIPEVKVTGEQGEMIVNTLGDVSVTITTETTSLLSPTPEAEVLMVNLTPSPAILPTIFHALFTHHKHTLGLLKRIKSSSLFSRTTFATYFILMFGTSIRVIFSQWSSLMYNWVFADVASLNSFEMVISGAVLLSIPYLSKFLTYKPGFDSPARVDVFIVKSSLLALALGLLLMAVAPSRALYVAAMAVFTLGCGVTQALRSFVTGMVGGDEVENLYLGIGVVETMGEMVATVWWSNLFAEVLGRGYWVERIPFMASAGVLLCVVGCVFLLGRFLRQHVGEEDEGTGCGDA